MLVAANIPLVQKIAYAVAARTPKYAIVGFDDFVSEGAIGLRQAVLTFDPSRGVKFATYASRRIHGAIIDGIRDADHAPRLMRKRGLAPNVGSIDAPIPGDERGGSIAGTLATENKFDAVDEEDQLAGMLKGLSDAEQAIIRMYYADSLKMSEIGQYLGLSESRISQMHDGILKRLKAKLSLNMKGLATTKRITDTRHVQNMGAAGLPEAMVDADYRVHPSASRVAEGLLA